MQHKKIPIDSFFEKVIAENVTIQKEDNAFYIDYLWDEENKTIEIIKVVEKELDFFPISERLLSKENPTNPDLIAPGKNIRYPVLREAKRFGLKNVMVSFHVVP